MPKNFLFIYTSDWSRLLSSDNSRHFRPCVLPHLTHWAPGHIEKPLCTVCMVPGLLTLKPCSCFSLGTCECSQTSLPMWAQMMFVFAYLQSLGAASSACFTTPWKGVSNQFSPLSQSGSVDYWQQVLIFFQKDSQIAFMLFQQQTELPGSARNTPALHQHRARVELGHLSLTAFVQIIYSCSFLRPPTRESVLVSIATCLVPPSFDVVSSPPVLSCLLDSEGEMAPLCQTNL